MSPRRAGKLRDRALVLRRHPYSESSLVVWVLTRREGLVHLLARGAYRPRSRYFAVLDLFDELELEWRPARGGGDLGQLVEGRLLQRRRGPTRDLRSFRAATTALELAAIGSRPGQPEPQLFDLLSGALDAAIMDGPDALDFVAEYPGRLAVIEQALASERYSIGVRPDDVELLEQVDGLLDELEAEGWLAGRALEFGLDPALVARPQDE